MAILRTIPRKGRRPSYSGRVMIDTVRGVLRVRRWPAKRGTPKSALHRFWVDWFRQANLLAKYADPMSMARAILMTKGTGLYPRDVLLKAMRGRLYTWADETGWRWYPVAAIGDISETLDVLAQTVGSVLVRAADRWRAPVAGSPGDVLTFQALPTAPVWQAPSGGVIQAVLVGTPITPDNTANAYVLAVTAELDLELMLDGLAYAASDRAVIQFSTDGGATYHTAATDYTQIFMTPTASGTQDLDRIYTSTSAAVAAQNTRVTFQNLRAGRVAYDLLAGVVGGASIHRSGFANFDGPVTHIKIFAHGANNFNAGVIRAVGLRAV